MHTCIQRYIHTCLYLPTYVGTYILHPTHPTGGGGEAEVPCMIVGFQGGSTPNPRNHPHRGGGGGVAGLYHIYIYLYMRYDIYSFIYIDKPSFATQQTVPGFEGSRVPFRLSWPAKKRTIPRPRDFSTQQSLLLHPRIWLRPSAKAHYQNKH